MILIQINDRHFSLKIDHSFKFCLKNITFKILFAFYIEILINFECFTEELLILVTVCLMRVAL